MQQLRQGLVLALILSLGGCGLIAAAIALPFRLLSGFSVGIAIGAEGMTAQEELWADGLEVDRYQVEIELRDDLTYTAHGEVIRTVVSASGLAEAQKASASYDPRTQQLELLLAEVINPDGSRHVVDRERVFTRPSAAAQNAPGFVSTRTMSILFPQLQVGSRTHVRWRFVEKGRSDLGFNHLWRAPFAYPVKEAQIRISHSGKVPLRYEARGPFELSERAGGRGTVVEATLRDYVAQEPERAMVDPLDVCPLFVATTLESWEEIGARFNEAVKDRIETTAEIRELAGRITAGRSGVEAARAVHRWVAENVRFVAVYLGQMDVWVPHPAGEVLASGYGDCKDQFVLLASLLRASGIECQPALARLGRSFETLPLATPLQFDHCLAYLPQFDLFSDPTDPYRDLGELDVPLSGKLVVLGTVEGRVMRTPEGNPDANRYQVHHDMKLDAGGNVSGSSVIEAKGRSSGFVRRVLARTGSAEQRADSLLQATFEGGSGSLRSTDPTDLSVPLRAEGSWESDLGVEMGDAIHFSVPAGIDLVNPSVIRRFVTDTDRRHPVVIAAVEIAWSYDLKLPAGYRFTRTPGNRQVGNDAASFVSRSRLDADDRLHVERTLRIHRDRFSADEYADLRAALNLAGNEARAVVSAERR